MAKKDTTKKSRSNDRVQDEFEQQIIDLARVTRVMAGGKRLRFRVCMVIGDRNGRVGFGIAKGADVALAINKAVAQARKNIIDVPLVKETIPHRLRIRFKSAEVLLKPAPSGTGVIAGGAVRQVLELAGVPNIVAKILGCNNKISNVKAVFKALETMQLKSGNREKKQDERKALPPKKQEKSRGGRPRRNDRPKKQHDTKSKDDSKNETKGAKAAPADNKEKKEATDKKSPETKQEASN